MTRLIFLALSLFVSIQSFAAEHKIGSPIADVQIKLRGEGIRNPDSKEIFYLACTELNDNCEDMQFILAKPDGTAYWWSQSFRAKNYEQFKKLMKNLNWASTPPQEGLHKFSEIFGTLFVFGGAGVAAATAGLGVGALAFALAVLVVSRSERGWETFDFLTYLPAQTTKMISENTLTSTQDQKGWGWSVKTHRMRAKKFVRMKKLLSHPFNFDLINGIMRLFYK